MKINTKFSQNKLYNSSNVQRPKYLKGWAVDSFTFTGNVNKFLCRETMDSVSSIAQAYQDILKTLSEKTPEGINLIEKEFKNFKAGRGLAFHNCGENNQSILIRMPENKDARDIVKIVVRKGNSFVDERIVLDSFTIKNFNQLIEDNNKNTVFSFPEQVKALNFDKQTEDRLGEVLQDLDFAMLNVRKFLRKFDGMYLKPEQFSFDYKTSQRLKNIEALYSKIEEGLNAIPHKFALKIKTEYGDYKLQAKQSTNVLTNIGDNQNQIVYKELEHPEHGKLVRLMVYDKQDNIVDGFLIKDGKHIVSNFNNKNFSIIPPKLLYHDKTSVQEILPKIETYITDYEKKLNDFNDYITNAVYKKSLSPVTGQLDSESMGSLDLINKLYDNLVEKFSKMQPKAVSDLKTSYGGWNASAGQRGFIFKTEQGDRVAILKMNSSDDNNIIRFSIMKDGAESLYLLNHGMVVKNFNPKYPTIVPPVLKYCTDTELDELNMFPIIKQAADELQKFYDYAKNPPQVEKPAKQLKKVLKNSEPKTETKQTHKEEKTNVKKHSLSSSKEYKLLMKECSQELTDAMKKAEHNMQGFNDTLNEIQKKVAAFFLNKAE